MPPVKSGVKNGYPPDDGFSLSQRGGSLSGPNDLGSTKSFSSKSLDAQRGGETLSVKTSSVQH